MTLEEATLHGRVFGCDVEFVDGTSEWRCVRGCGMTSPKNEFRKFLDYLMDLYKMPKQGEK